jgi:hypothetical protein
LTKVAAEVGVAKLLLLSVIVFVITTAKVPTSAFLLD